jgi:hypothetical protein
MLALNGTKRLQIEAIWDRLLNRTNPWAEALVHEICHVGASPQEMARG